MICQYLCRLPGGANDKPSVISSASIYRRSLAMVSLMAGLRVQNLWTFTSGRPQHVFEPLKSLIVFHMFETFS